VKFGGFSGHPSQASPLSSALKLCVRCLPSSTACPLTLQAAELDKRVAPREARHGPPWRCFGSGSGSPRRRSYGGGPSSRTNFTSTTKMPHQAPPWRRMTALRRERHRVRVVNLAAVRCRLTGADPAGRSRGTARGEVDTPFD